MPYKRIGRTIFVKRDDHWIIKQKMGNVTKAKAALRLLEGLKEK
jgi:hypothetical protein